PAGTRRPHAPEALGTAPGAEQRAVEEDLRRPLELQQVAGLEIGEEKPGLGMDEEIAQRVEEAVAAEIRHQQRAIALDADEARPAPAMGHIDAKTGCIGGGDEEGIRAGDERTGLVVEGRKRLDP